MPIDDPRRNWANSLRAQGRYEAYSAILRWIQTNKDPEFVVMNLNERIEKAKQIIDDHKQQRLDHIQRKENNVIRSRRNLDRLSR